MGYSAEKWEDDNGNGYFRLRTVGLEVRDLVGHRCDMNGPGWFPHSRAWSLRPALPRICRGNAPRIQLNIVPLIPVGLSVCRSTRASSVASLCHPLHKVNRAKTASERCPRRWYLLSSVELRSARLPGQRLRQAEIYPLERAKAKLVLVILVARRGEHAQSFCVRSSLDFTFA